MPLESGATTKSVLENISTFSSSADDIWSYLDEKYGKSEVVAKEVMTELMALDPKKLGQRFMGRFCTMVLDTYKLLAEMGEQDWLVSNRAVAELEGKLPREERLEWAKLCGTVEGDTKFEKFSNFLKLRKSVMETMESMTYRLGGTSAGSSRGINEMVS